MRSVRFGPAHARTPATSAIVMISIADKHNPNSRVNSSITNTTQSNMGDVKKNKVIWFHSPFSFFLLLLLGSSYSERSFHEKTIAFQIQNT
jgi:hypothetical protein